MLSMEYLKLDEVLYERIAHFMERFLVLGYWIDNNNLIIL